MNSFVDLFNVLTVYFDNADLNFMTDTLCRFQLKQEQENHRHTTMKYSTAADKMRRMDEEHQKEIQEMQKVHMNLELEIKRLVNNMKQVHFLNSFFFFFCESKTVKMCFLSHYNYCIVFTTVVIVLTV